ncbi:MAG TPA: T9SS type A sorting domain-containing protein, partial [Bacteroidales bacterium]|nr:T9SS type A sorting domain-containing protein [Bacteroidales bacterium]
RIALTQDNTLIGRAFADDNGNANIGLSEIISSSSQITISITAHNKELHLGTINVIADIPYVVADYFTINDDIGNANGQADYGEKILLGLGMKNLGNLPANDVTVKISSFDSYITLSYLAVEFGDIGPGETVFIDDAFPVIISEKIPDQHEVQIYVKAESDDTWISNIYFTVNAPSIKTINMTIDDEEGGNGNSKLDPGENVIFRFDVKNNGHALSPDISIQLTSNNSKVVITSEPINQQGLEPDEEYQVEFTAIVDTEAVMGDVASLQAKIIAGEYITTDNYLFKIGMITEDFESSDFSLLNWEFDGDKPWFISETDPWEGLFCAQSGDITHEQKSELKISVFVAQIDTVSFYQKVSSETNKDFLRFYDGPLLKKEWSGNNDWEEAFFIVYPGYHEFRWVYEKNNENSHYDDCARIDYIKFPKLLESKLEAGGDDMVCIGDDHQVKSSGIYIMSIQWETSGSGTFNNPNTLQPIYTPSEEDILNGEVILSVSAIGANNQPLSDSMTLEIIDEPPIPLKPVGEIQVCTNFGKSYQYSTQEFPEIRAYIWELNPEEAGSWLGNENIIDIVWTPDFVGNISLKVKGVNPCGESIFSDSLNIEAFICDAIEEKTKEELVIYPNPTDRIIYLTIPGEMSENEIVIYNSTGIEVFRQKDENIVTELKLDLHNLPKGIYLLKTVNDRKVLTAKLILK